MTFVQSIDSENYSQYHIETIAEIEQKSENCIELLHKQLFQNRFGRGVEAPSVPFPYSISLNIVVE